MAVLREGIHKACATLFSRVIGNYLLISAQNKLGISL